MKIFIPIFFCIALIGCKAKNLNLISEKQVFQSSNYCPDDGVCSYELIPNSSLDIKKDGLGSLYATVEEGENIIFKFSYKRNTPEGVQDGNYSEEVYLELDSNLSDINIKGKELYRVKPLFNRMCFCKGQAGFYKIQQGNLFVKKTDHKTYNIQLEIKVDEVPQVVTRINETFILE